MQKPYIALSRRAKSFKDYRKGKSPCSKAGGVMDGGMDRDAGEPAYKNAYADPPGVVLNLECRSTQDFTIAQKQATALVNSLYGSNEDVPLLFRGGAFSLSRTFVP